MENRRTVVVLVCFTLLICLSQAQLSVQEFNLENTKCDAKPTFGVWWEPGLCYDQKGQFSKVSCNALWTTFHRQCDTTCTRCENVSRVPNICVASNPNSFQFSCGNIPKLQPKGFAYKTFPSDRCNANEAQNFYITDEYCFAQENMVPGLVGTFFKNVQSLKLRWNAEKRGAEFIPFQKPKCEGEEIATVLIKEKVCTVLGGNHISVFKP
jgi:hypothetical protein